ncbi:radical SAM protein [Desulfoprunum benzoelyticum]|uniref:Wyosine [tRNA(Phe)-imidazoG37] synthetase (Radical SAM superfamily) n=1 Tax=Desulfoprunum benzoelyticum TaxID=1506996 RepID=A0A840UU43_9BACT|nr:radical SAM protein [Desulfoprunum benzoelyticum]MBB5348283.1 wyosine [tRNA(Phe)-imidazoG37] synthetase (radical SAM superfamily) [Desulfoprunum benzoelyticum]MBM9529526.1 radical SAM protein [Desulfoprunum benzoelyticum]
MAYTYLFGPVPSRRLGMSLGVDLVPRKVCTLDCVYCEVGRTTTLTSERKEYIPAAAIIEELGRFFATNTTAIDYITISGSGEPTLNSGIGDIVGYIRRNIRDISLAVLTNGTLLNDKNVREALLATDVVLPSLDAATAPVFARINRHHRSITVDQHIAGLVSFRQEYRGKIWLEVFILPGYNDSDAELQAIRQAILKIQPDSVQLNTLDRPGTVAGLRGATPAELETIVQSLDLKYVEIITAGGASGNVTSCRKEAESVLLEMISRRPCTLDDLVLTLGMSPHAVKKIVAALQTAETIESVRQERGVFYQLKNK